MRFSIFAMTAIFLGLASGAQAADLKVDLLDCRKFICHGKQMRLYTFKPGETCNSIYAKLNFVSVIQLDRINTDISRSKFQCGNARAGTLICYPQIERAGKC